MRYAVIGMVLLTVCAGAQQPLASAPMTRMTYVGAEGSRAFLTYRPATFPTRAADRALVVMLHGCTQDAEDMARGTRMNASAEAVGFMVVYPEQPASAHVQKCWNWYDPAQIMRGHGEVAILAGLIDSVAGASGIAARRVALVGMSAGAAMAANLAVAYPERYAALALHSGLPALAARDLMTALAAMRVGVGDGDALGISALAAMGEFARPIPVYALHGATDAVVSMTNLAAIGRQWTVINARARGNGARVVADVIQGVGHAWSGGSPDGTYTAPSGPNATGMIVEFLKSVGVLSNGR